MAFAETTAPDASLGSGVHRGLTPIVSAALFLEAMTISITAIAIPRMHQDLGVSLASLQWTHGAFIIGFAGLLLLGGRFADLYGRRTVFLSAVVLFGLAGGAVAAAPSLTLLFVARGLQGAAAAFMIPAAMSILTEAFPDGPKRDQALSTFNAAGAAGFSAGLVIGGAVIEYLGWRWSFGLNLPVAMIIFALGLFIIPSIRRAAVQKLDWIGAFMVVTALSLITLALTLTAEHGVTHIEIGLGLTAVLIGVLFVAFERGHPSPLLPLSLFALPTLRMANLASLTLLGAFFGLNILVNMALSVQHGLSALDAGLVLLPMGLLCVVVAQVVTPRLLQLFDLRFVGAAGLTMIAAAAIILSSAGQDADVLTLAGAATLAGGIGMGLAYAPLAIEAVRGVEAKDQGVAAGLQQTLLQIGGVLGIALTVIADTVVPGVGGYAVSVVLALIGTVIFCARSRHSRVSE
ncbi:MFS transporter [uncultured Roseobacter sp.]|uniref:MFS transporter n=1 Tax=uncultured Roseobacter sp. TaxID=114847 RepID=UPI00262FA5C8|nr:MFS transporter [uncultured Roseobacter sp.]